MLSSSKFYTNALALVLFFTLSSCSNSNNRELEKNLSIQEDTFTQGILDNYQVNLFNQFISDGRELSPDVILQDHLLQEVALGDIIKEPTLVFRFSELHCQVCIDQEIKKLNSYFPKLKNRVIIITSYNSSRDFNVFRRLNQIEMPIYKLSKNLNLDIEEAYTPYLFMLDSNLKIHHMFIPDKLYPNVSDSFYEGFITRYLQ